MHRVLADVEGEELAKGALGGLLGIGGTHDFTVARHGVVAFQHLDHDRRRGHGLDQLAVEGPVLVNLIEALGLGLGHVDATLGDDAQARVLDDGIDLAGEVPLCGVRLDDREGVLGHEGLFPV